MNADDEDPEGGEWINSSNLAQVAAKARYGTEDVKKIIISC